MKKLLVAAFVATSIFGGVGVAKADKPADPGREFGQCTAYFNGQKNGHEEGTMDEIQAMYDDCQAFGIGGNPTHGRYPECFNGDSDGDGQTCDD